jgi:hypothetical protein
MLTLYRHPYFLPARRRTSEPIEPELMEALERRMPGLTMDSYKLPRRASRTEPSRTWPPRSEERSRHGGVEPSPPTGHREA